MIDQSHTDGPTSPDSQARVASGNESERSDGKTAGMPAEDFRRFGHQIVDWLADYWEHPERHAVLPRAKPGELIDKLPAVGPDQGEPMERILADFESQILPHVTHWNHPGFLGFFATSASAPGVLAETLAAGLNNVGLLWKASPALAELEQVTLCWLADWMGLPTEWFGMIHTTASEASLHAVIAAREAARQADGKTGKPFDLARMVIYTSEQAHSSVEKTTLSLGLGRDGCRKIAVDSEFRMRPESLEAAIQSDLKAGLRPVCIVATVGTTSTSSVDPVREIAAIAERHELWLHVDAAYAGAAAILPEMRRHLAGCDRADSFLVNPHKWLFTPMDLCAFYTRRPDILRDAFSLIPEYLRSQEDPRAVNLMEYSIPLGRRFRALKLWFILRYFGREGLSAILREHIRAAQKLAQRIDEHSDFERVAPAPFSLVCIRYRPPGLDPSQLDSINEKLLNAINATGEFFLSHTKLNGRFVIRVAVGNIHTRDKHLDRFWDLLLETANAVANSA